MKRAGYFIVIFILISPALFQSNSALDGENFSEIISSGKYGSGYRYNIQGWVYLHLEGEPYDRGYQYGYLASAEIIEMMQRWGNFAQSVKFMKLFIFKNHPDRYDELSEKWWDICRTRSMNVFLKEIPDEYVEELHGMTDGIKARGGKIFGRDVEFEDVVASQFVQEIQYTLDIMRKGIHPILSMASSLKDIISGDILNPDGHCNAFIATGDATKDGGIVAAHSTIFPNYIAERCNFIVEIKPTDGYRFIMTCPPGSLWSQEDWYQNEQGIILTETELRPQGPWDITKTRPKGVRSRTAIQYSSSISEVVENIEKGNNGLIPNEWLIGDKKTNEIASYEQGLYFQNFKSTDNGFYWSANFPQKINILSELTGIPRVLLRFYSFITLGKGFFKFEGQDIIWKDDRVHKLIDYSEQYYGKIDTENAKMILSSPPLVDYITDCKITDSKLAENLGIICFMGKSNGVTWVPDEKSEKDFRGVTILPPTGWVELYPTNSERGDLFSFKYKNEDESYDYFEEGHINSKLLWSYDTKNNGNMNYSNCVFNDGVIYSTSSKGTINALNSEDGKEKWNVKIAENSVDPAFSNDVLFIGTDKGIHAINKDDGATIWEKLIGRISSKPIVSGNNVFVGCDDGEIYVFDTDSGDKIWDYSLNDAVFVSELDKSNVFYVGSGKTCYCFDYMKKDKIWSYETDGFITSSPKVNGDHVYLGSWDGNIYCLDARNGDKIWSYETGWGIDSTPSVSDGYVFVGSLDNNFYALDAYNGDPEWYFNCNAAIHSSSVTYGDYVFFGCDDGRMYALEKSNGSLAWSFAPGYFITRTDVNNYITTPILSNPYVHDGKVYFGAKGNVYALDAQTFEKPVVTQAKESDMSQGLLLVFSILVIVCLIVIILIYPKKKK